MAEDSTLPGIVYGPGLDGFTILGVSPRLPDGARKVFINFAKSVTWRPAKLEAPHAVALALIPSPDGVVVCRMSECSVDAYGRGLAMRVEGVLCGHNDAIWRRFAASDAWPVETVSNPCEVPALTAVDADSVPRVNWSPRTGEPLILSSRILVNAPARWFAS